MSRDIQIPLGKKEKENIVAASFLKKKLEGGQACKFISRIHGGKLLIGDIPLAGIQVTLNNTKNSIIVTIQDPQCVSEKISVLLKKIGSVQSKIDGWKAQESELIICLKQICDKCTEILQEVLALEEDDTLDFREPYSE